jgi:probable rRNA maturation factor
VTVDVDVENRTGHAIDEDEVRRILVGVLRAEGVAAAEVGVAFVPADEMAALNTAHRAVAAPTDVLSFPIDGREPLAGGLPRQLGDLVVCPEVAERDGTPVPVLLVHGALHLVGYDHEADDGEMLARQAELMAEVGGGAAEPR